jgi:hypothetical protein
MPSAPVPDWARAQGHARKSLSDWISTSIERHSAVEYHGIHDEGSFTASWDAYYFTTQDARIRDFLVWLRDGFARWGSENLLHGYYAEGEVHHATEPFTHFIARFRTLAPDDPVTAKLLEDAAEHLGNWVPAIPEWYDWRTHSMRSWRIGTRVVKTTPPDDYEEPDSARPAIFALAAYATTGKERYLALCCDYADKWAAALLEKPLPRVRFLLSSEDSYNDRIAIQATGDLLLRLELVVASGMADWLLDLYHITEKPTYRDALEVVMGGLAQVVADPRNSICAALLGKYRRITGDTQFDTSILDGLGDPPLYDSGPLVLRDDWRDAHETRKGRSMILNKRIGHRFDQIRWGDADGNEIVEPTGSAWALAWQITGNPKYAARALFLAGERLRLAATKLDDGRDHGCGGNTTGAVASGHGRADRYGHVNAVWGPLVLGSTRVFSAEEPLLNYPNGLPYDLASLIRFAPEPAVEWINTGNAPVTFTWLDRSLGTPVEREITLAPGRRAEAGLGSALPLLKIPPN